MKHLALFFILILILVPASGFAAILFEDGFESGDFSYRDPTSGSEWLEVEHSDEDSVTVSTENPHNGDYSAKFHFSGNTDLTDDAWAELNYLVSDQGESDWYLSFYAYYPNNYVIRDADGSDNNKVTSTWGDEYGEDGRYNIELGGTTYNLRIRQRRQEPYPYENAQCPEDGGILTSGPNEPVWDGLLDTRGKWTHWEFHLKMDDGSSNGEKQLWIDGVLVLSETNIYVVGAPCTPFYIRHGYLMGWANSGFDEDTDVYIDDVVFSTTRVGGDPPQPPSEGSPIGGNGDLRFGGNSSARVK